MADRQARRLSEIGVQIIKPRKEPVEQSLTIERTNTHVTLSSSEPISRMQFTPDQARGLAAALITLADMVEEGQKPKEDE